MSPPITQRVFFSYSHDSETHRDTVLALAQELRAWGVDVRLDRFVPAPAEGWPRWMMGEVEAADFVIIVCTETYRRRFDGREKIGKGMGATFEGLLAIQHIYNNSSQNRKFIPITFSSTQNNAIPTALQPYTHYTLPQQFEALYRHIQGQPEIVPAPLGVPRILTSTHNPTHPVLPVSISPPPGLRKSVALAEIRSDGDVTSYILLHRLLISLFGSTSAFREWASRGSAADAALAAKSPTTIINSDLEELGDLIDNETFIRLRTDFPDRIAEIEHVVEACST